MRFASTLTVILLWASLLAQALTDDASELASGMRRRRLLQAGLPQQALSNIASLAGQLSSFTNPGGANQPIASSAFQVLGAVQAPQSSTYDSNLAGSVVQLIQSAVSAQSPPPAAAGTLVQILQNILDSASASLTALVSQGLRQRAVLPLALFGPEGNFGNGSQIIQAVARILGTALPLPQAALAPAPSAIYSLPPAQIVTAAGDPLAPAPGSAMQANLPQVQDISSFPALAPGLGPSPAMGPAQSDRPVSVPRAAQSLPALPSVLALPSILAAPVETLQDLENPSREAEIALPGGNDALLLAVQSLLILPGFNTSGGANAPIANSTMQVLSAQQAPQSSTYNSNLAGSIVQLIGLGVNGQAMPPNAASALVAILQAVLGNASPSLTALMSQDLRQRNILPLALFGPEGSFSSGPQIIQAVAGILGVALPPSALAPAPMGGDLAASQAMPMSQAPDTQHSSPAPVLSLSPAMEPVQGSMPLPEASPPPSGLGSVLAGPGAALQEIQHVLVNPFMEAARAMPSGGNPLQRAVQSLFQRSTPNPSGIALAPSLGAAPSLAPVGDGYDPAQLAYVPSIYSQPAPIFFDTKPFGAFSRSPIAAPELAPSYDDVLPYGGPPLSSMPVPGFAPMLAPSPAPSRSLLFPFDQSLPPFPSLTAVLPVLESNSSISLDVELANLISDAQSGGVQKVVEEIVANPSAYLVTIAKTLTRIPWVSSILKFVENLPKLFRLPSITPLKGDAPATLGDAYVKGTLQLPYKSGPSCSAKSVSLTLVPWSCLLDAFNNTVSCSDSYLLYEELPESCSLLHISDGVLAGRECPSRHTIGVKEDMFSGGQKLQLKVKDVLKALSASGT